MGSFLQDLRYGCRLLLKSPGFASVIVVTLALGIGANTAIFSIVNAVLLRPLPYKDAGRLVLISAYDVQNRFPASSYSSFPRYTFIKDQSSAFESLTAVARDSFNLTGRDVPEQIEGARVSGDLFETLGEKPFIGHAFLPEEDRPGGDRVAILGYGLWRRLFDADAGVLGRAIELDGQSITVIGVMPPDFKFLDDKIDVWVPRSFEIGYFAPESIRLSASFLRVIGRLKPGVEMAEAQSELDTIITHYKQYNPNGDVAYNSRLTPLHESMVSGVRQTLLIVSAIVGLVLFIACVNVTNLLLARSAARRREFAIRTALGATRLQLIRQVLTESVLLSVLGGAAGVFVAYLGIKLLLAANPKSIPRLDEIGLDLSVLGFTLAVSVLAGLVFGLAPAFESSETNLNETLKAAGRSGAGDARGNRLRRALVVVEIALALMVLIGAGLLIQSVHRMRHNSVGMDYTNLLTMSLTLPRPRYPGPGEQAGFYKRVLERVRGLPGVTDVAAVSVLPLIGAGTRGVVTVPGVADADLERRPIVSGRLVSPDYFRTLSIPVLAGRDFTERDAERSPDVIIVNESFARHFWPGQDPVGKRFSYSTRKIECEVVGVVADTKFKVSDAESREEIYMLYLQRPRLSLNLLVRTAVEPLALAAPVQNEIWAIDKDQPVVEVQTLEQVIGESIEQPRLTMKLLSALGLVALILSMVGLYGVMSYLVTQRTHEIGLRMAVGAGTLDVLRLVMGQGMKLALVGLALGCVGALALARFIKSLLFGVSATDPATFVAITLLLAGVALLASYIPARRATKVDPMVALRGE